MSPQKVFKYEIPVLDNDRFSLSMPKDARILTAQLQNGQPVLWALVNPNLEKEERRFLSVGTGEYMYHKEAKGEYIASYQDDEFCVWHLFEIK